MITVGTKVSFTPEALETFPYLKCSCSDIFTVTWVSQGSSVKLDPPINDIENPFTFAKFHTNYLVEV